MKEEIKMKVNLFFLIVVVLCMSSTVLAGSPIIPDPKNKEACENTEGYWLTIIHGNFFWDSSDYYLASDIYCKCDENKFIKITRLDNWEGCNQEAEYMDEINFINELEVSSKWAKDVSANMDDKFINIAQKNVNLARFYSYGLVIFLTVIFILVCYLGVRKYRTRKK